MAVWSLSYSISFHISHISPVVPSFFVPRSLCHPSIHPSIQKSFFPQHCSASTYLWVMRLTLKDVIKILCYCNLKCGKKGKQLSQLDFEKEKSYHNYHSLRRETRRYTLGPSVRGGKSSAVRTVAAYMWMEPKPESDYTVGIVHAEAPND